MVTGCVPNLGDCNVMCVSGGEGGGLEKFTESARRVTTQQSELRSASSA